MGAQILMRSVDIVGMQVKTIEQDANVNLVGDVIIDQDQQELAALVLGTTKLSDSEIVPFSAVEEIVGDTIFISSQKQVQPANSFVDKPNQATSEKFQLSDTPVEVNGEKMGTVSDIYFDPETGKIKEIEYQLRNQHTRKRLPIDQVREITDRKVVLKKQLEAPVAPTRQRPDHNKSQHASEKANKGKGFLKQAENTLEEAFHTVETNLEDFSQSVTGQKQGQASGSVRNQEMPEEVIGKYLTKNILTDRDKMVGKRGQMITHKMAKKAGDHQLLDQMRQYSSEEPVGK